MVPYKWQARNPGAEVEAAGGPTVSWRSSKDLGIYGRKADCTWHSRCRLGFFLTFCTLEKWGRLLKECLTRDLEILRLKTKSYTPRKLHYMVFASRLYMSYCLYVIAGARSLRLQKKVIRTNLILLYHVWTLTPDRELSILGLVPWN